MQFTFLKLLVYLSCDGIYVTETALATMEPPKPSRRVKKLELEIDYLSREQRQTTEGVCKRRLDLFKVQGMYFCI
jgi:hypothetical protein